MTKALRCAIYTRKSSEEGLEQDFNSLHAQREACEAFIKSQRHEGWELVEAAYDDGGISGGTMQRPALQRLLDDIRNREVDIIVVYKVDRLTRSLADFARMVELFDAQGVSFVSVTQQFNTTSSMGRLTLNVLLSFAQFEREVTGERIRDKIKASKAKGIFMGGRVPLGYRVEDRKLNIVEDEAKTVRHIYERYLALGCVPDLKRELDRHNIRGRAANAVDGSGKAARFSRGALHDLLRNPAYVGMIRHKDTCHQGQHEPILTRELWNAVQAQLDANRNGPKMPTAPRKTEPAALIGKVVDEAGERLTPTHTIKKGRRYRYYISQRLTRQGGDTGWRLPGKRFEDLVSKAVRQIFSDSVALSLALQAAGVPATAFGTMIAAIKHRMTEVSDEHLLTQVVKQIQLESASMRLTLDLSSMIDQQGQADQPLLIERLVPIDMKRRGVEMRLVLRSHNNITANVDPILVKIIAKAHTWFEDLATGSVANIKELAAREGVSPSYVGDLLKLAFLSPRVVEQIVAGQQPANLVADHLIRAHALPFDWDAQEQLLGFA
ncbi:recombinase family protein [Asticcacaulis solisilvae]|uniref:recombinase family protein n=1 Tax=Asticcacaulis solisilvae TaxID=1217274 RepID=UPI003FD7B65A